MKSVLIKRAITFLGVLPLLISCSSNEPQNTIRSKLIKEYQIIKDDYYQQFIVRNNITNDKEFLDYVGLESIYETDYPNAYRKITKDSLLLNRQYAKFDDAYLVDFLVNDWIGSGTNFARTSMPLRKRVNPKKWPESHYYYLQVGDYSIFTSEILPPVLWKDGVIYSMNDAYEKGYITDEFLSSLVENEQNLIILNNLDYKFVQIEHTFEEYDYCLPDFINGKSGSYTLPKMEVKNNSITKRIKEDFYKQRFVKKNFFDDREYCGFYVPRMIDESSVDLDIVCKLNSDVYAFTPSVNGHGFLGFAHFATKKCFADGSVLYYYGSVEPEIWKNGVVYHVDEAIEKGIVSTSVLCDKWNNWDHEDRFRVTNWSPKYLKNPLVEQKL